MPIIKKPVAELLDYEFVIPNYQRGYRWDKEQVTALLNDLKTFQKTADSDDFYCLQPIVVVADKEKRNRYEIVDGQQRLTTILLILKAFGGLAEKCYTLEMDKRKEQEKYIAENSFAEADKTYKKKIDNFYVRKAYESILEWKDEKPENATAALFLTTLLKPGHIKGYAAVIWYEIDKMDALSAFRRLNYGKIPLTSAELVKALLLQTDCYSEQERKTQETIALRRAMEWDEMEYRLANPMFYAMVCRNDEEPDKGIEIILDFVADRLNLLLSKNLVRKKETDKRVDHFVYNVIDSRISEEIAKGRTRQDVVAEIWGMIQETFNRLVDWYENRVRYHLIGLWRLLYSGKSRRFIREVYNKMFVDGNPEKPMLSKPTFVDAIRKHIGTNYLKVPIAKKYDEETNTTVALSDDKQHLNSPELRYKGSQHARLINILTAFNVMTVQNDDSGATRFPFHLFQKYNTTSLEHIHPQNISRDIKWEEAVRWVNDRERDIADADDKAWLSLAKYFTSKQLLSADEESIETAKRRIEQSINALAGLLANEKTFDENLEEAFEHLQNLDHLFGDIVGIDEDQLHSIGNLALVSKELNSALGNRHLDAKRSIALEYDAQPLTDKRATFVPPATHKVFSKAYRPNKPGNMKFWQLEDRTKYKEAIQQVYDYFTK